MRRVVLVGDGTPTLGETHGAALAAMLGSAELERIDAIRLGQSSDRDTLGPIVRAGAHPGAILDGADAARAVRQLGTAIVPEQPIHVEGASATWPATTRGLAPGEPVWVFGHRRAVPGAIAIRIGDHAATVTARPADPARVARAVAGAELAALSEQLQASKTDAARRELEASIERVALAHGLVSARTSLLVLESDDDERRTLDAAPTGETIRITGTAPAVDAGSTRQGITITADYLRNVPTGRTFAGVLGDARGRQVDGVGASLQGATSSEMRYIVDGVASTVVAGSMGMSPLSHEHTARLLASTAFPFGMPPVRDEDAPPAGKAEPAAPLARPPLAAVYTGTMLDVMKLLAAHDGRALEVAAAWHLRDPGDVAATIALGEALEARGALALAARAYASIADLYPNRAELLRAAGSRLDRIGQHALAIDVYRRALRERPDHVSTYRLLAYALLRADRLDEALDVLGAGLVRSTWPSVTQILGEDAGLVAAAIVARDPSKRARVAGRMRYGIAARPTLRIVLSWETDANDVDLHVADRRGDHAFYGRRTLPSGGTLLDDLTDGYGPEMFVIDAPAAFPYRIAAHYYRRGPMGVGLGTAQVIRHDGEGHLTVEDRPFALQVDGATVDLGEIR